MKDMDIKITGIEMSREINKLHDADGKIVHYEPLPESEVLTLTLEVSQEDLTVSKKVAIKAEPEGNKILAAIRQLAEIFKPEDWSSRIVKKEPGSRNITVDLLTHENYCKGARPGDVISHPKYGELKLIAMHQLNPDLWTLNVVQVEGQ